MKKNAFLCSWGLITALLTNFAFGQNNFVNSSGIEGSSERFMSQSIGYFDDSGNSGYFETGLRYNSGFSSVHDIYISKKDNFGNAIWWKTLNSTSTDFWNNRMHTNYVEKDDAVMYFAANVSNKLRVHKIDDAGNFNWTFEVNGNHHPLKIKKVSINNDDAYIVIAALKTSSVEKISLTAFRSNGTVLWSNEYESIGGFQGVSTYAAFTQVSATGEILICYGIFSTSMVEHFRINENNGNVINNSYELQEIVYTGSATIAPPVIIYDIIEIPEPGGSNTHFLMSGTFDQEGFIAKLNHNYTFDWAKEISGYNLSVSTIHSHLTHIDNDGLNIKILGNISRFNDVGRLTLTSFTVTSSGINSLNGTEFVNSTEFVNVRPFNFTHSPNNTLVVPGGISLSGGNGRAMFMALNSSDNLSGGCGALSSESLSESTFTLGTTAQLTPTRTALSTSSVSPSVTSNAPESSYFCNNPCIVSGLWVDITSTGGICSTGGGSVTLTAHTTCTTCNYIWSNAGENTTSINVSSAGTYAVTIIDPATSCKAINYFTVTADDPITPANHSIETSNTNSAFCNRFSHNFYLDPLPGDLNPSFDWDFKHGQGSTDESPYIVFNTNYGWRHIDLDYTNACGTYPFSLPVNVVGFDNTTNITQPACFGQTGAASITINSSHPASPTFNWSNSLGTGSSVSGLNAGSYFVTIALPSPNAYCFSVDQIHINPAPSELTVDNNDVTIVNESCFWMYNGSITLPTSLGGTPPYTFLWSNSATTKDISNLGAGFYTVTITDNNGCTFINSTPYEVENDIQGALTSFQEIENGASCIGVCDGEAGIASYSTIGTVNSVDFVWANGSTAQLLDDLCEGDHELEIHVDGIGSGCYYYYDFYIPTPDDAAWHVYSESSGGNTRIVDIESDEDENIYVIGTFEERAEFAVGAANPSTPVVVEMDNGLSGVFIAKYNQCGNIEWVAYTNEDPTFSSNFYEGVDIELRNGELRMLFYTDDANATVGDFIVKDASNTQIGGSPYTMAQSLTNDKYFVGSIEFDGTAIHDLYSVDITFGANDKLTSVDFYDNHYFVAGRHNDAGIVTELELNTSLTPPVYEFHASNQIHSNDDINVSTPTPGNGIDIVNDMEIVGAYVYLTGKFSLASSGHFFTPTGLGNIATNGLEDMYAGVMRAINLNDGFELTSAVCEIQGNTTDGAEGIEIDFWSSSVSGDLEMYIVGNYTGDLNTFNCNHGGVPNAFVVGIQFDPSGGLTPITGGTNDCYTFDGSQINNARGTGVIIDKHKERIYAVGTFEGDYLEPIAGGQGAPISGNSLQNMWHCAIELDYSTGFINGGISNEAIEVNGVAYLKYGNSFAGGSYKEGMDLHYGPVNHLANPTNYEAFVTRVGYDYPGQFGQYYKTDPNPIASKEEIKPVQKDFACAIYPNPGHGQINVVLNSTYSEAWNCEIYSSIGTLVFNKNNMDASNTLLNADISRLAPGLYMVRISQGTHSDVQRLIVY